MAAFAAVAKLHIAQPITIFSYARSKSTCSRIAKRLPDRSRMRLTPAERGGTAGNPVARAYIACWWREASGRRKNTDWIPGGGANQIARKFYVI
jgi:hypothetical protein